MFCKYRNTFTVQTLRLALSFYKQLSRNLKKRLISISKVAETGRNTHSVCGRCVCVACYLKLCVFAHGRPWMRTSLTGC